MKMMERRVEDIVTQEFYDKIMKASRFIKKGDPLKDVLDRRDIEEAILLLAKLLKEKRR